jgi:hypothetical protein
MHQRAEHSEVNSGQQFPLHIAVDTCPTCGQEIPPDKIEEIGGSIAAKEREQTLTITAKLEKRFAQELELAGAQAQANIKFERDQSAIREATARREGREAAEKLVGEKQRELEQVIAALRQQIDAAESRRQSAEETEASLRTEMEDLRQAGAAALEAAGAAARQREMEIRDEATRNAESSAANRIAMIEAAQMEAEAALRSHIDEAEQGRILAEQGGAGLKLQLDEMAKSREAEILKVREEAANDAARIRQLAAEAAELRSKDALASSEKATAKAEERAHDAEQRLVVLEGDLNTQREVLEKAKEDAINVEKARGFERDQKHLAKIAELQRAFEQKTNEELGEGAEVNVYEALKAEFPDDRIVRIPKGAPGADIRHPVLTSAMLLCFAAKSAGPSSTIQRITNSGAKSMSPNSRRISSPRRLSMQFSLRTNSRSASASFTCKMECCLRTRLELWLSPASFEVTCCNFILSVSARSSVRVRQQLFMNSLPLSAAHCFWAASMSGLPAC